MQKRHSIRHLAWRSGVAVVSQAMMFTGLYPVVPHLVRGRVSARTLLSEWGMSAALSAARPVGFLPLPGSRRQGPRPVVVLHGYAMNRANFVPLAFRLARAGLGPIVGFEYWTLGRTAAAARQLAWFVEHVQAMIVVIIQPHGQAAAEIIQIKPRSRSFEDELAAPIDVPLAGIAGAECHQKILGAVVVEIRPGCAMRISAWPVREISDRRGDVGESAVTAVLEHALGGAVIADEQIGEPIAIHIAPRRAVRFTAVRQSGGIGHV